MTKPALHGLAHLLVSSSLSSTSHPYPSSLGLPIPDFSDFIALVTGLTTAILVDLRSPRAAILWSGLHHFNLKSATPNVIPLFDVSPKELLQQQRPLQGSALESRLWLHLGPAMLAVQNAIRLTKAKEILQEKSTWLQVNVPKKDADSNDDAASSVSSSASVATPGPSSSPSDTSSERRHRPVDLARVTSSDASPTSRAFFASQRTVILAPWDDSSWNLLSETFANQPPM